MGFFSTEQWVGMELPKVFAFFSNPNNLPVIMPAELQCQVQSIDLVEPPKRTGLEFAAGPGTKITFSFRPVPFLPIRQKWVAEILEYEYLSYFRDRQMKGPFQSWDHRHEFKAESRDGKPGTLIADHVRFEVGYGMLGGLIEKQITARMQATFAHRQATLESALR